MKRASVCFDQSRATDVDAVEKLKYQSLLKEYLELQKEYVSRKRKLQAAKQKRKLSLAEVRFLKRKHAYLLKSKSPSSDKDLLHLPNTLQGGRNLSSERWRGRWRDLVQDKGEGKGKICWLDQVTLNA